MEKELIELFEAVKKAAHAAANDGGAVSSPEEERCLDALGQLKEFPVNYQVLVSTQVGKHLRHLTKHPRKKINALASEVIGIWKDIIVSETMINKKNGSSDNKGSAKLKHSDAQTSEVNRVQKSESLKVDKVGLEKNGQNGRLNSFKLEKSVTFLAEKKVETSDVVKAIKNTAGEPLKFQDTIQEEKQTSDLRKLMPPPAAPPKLTSIIYCKDSWRDKIRELLSEALCKVAGEVDEHLKNEVDDCDPYRVAVSVESAMFEKWGRSNGAQKFKYRSIMFNMKDPKNPDFRRKVLLGHYKPEMIPELTPDEMASDQRQKQNEKIKEKALFECERGMQPKATTDQFKCGRCQQRKCTYYQLQTRSADEPMTTFVTCVNCNNHWKFC